MFYSKILMIKNNTFLSIIIFNLQLFKNYVKINNSTDRIFRKKTVT